MVRNHDVTHQYFRSEVTSKSQVNSTSSATGYYLWHGTQLTEKAISLTSRQVKHSEDLMGDVMIYTGQVLHSDHEMVCFQRFQIDIIITSASA
jgi:hypothetical protein